MSSERWAVSSNSFSAYFCTACEENSQQRVVNYTMTHFENEKENENDLSHGYDCQVFLILILLIESIWFRLGRVS